MSMDNSMMVFFLSMLATYSIVGFVWWLLHVVAAWRIFTKAGEAGWKSIIPIYNFLEEKESFLGHSGGYRSGFRAVSLLHSGGRLD